MVITTTFSKSIEDQTTIFKEDLVITMEAQTMVEILDLVSIEIMLEEMEEMLEALSLVNYVEESTMVLRLADLSQISSKTTPLMTLHVSTVARTIILQIYASISLASLVNNNKRTQLFIKLLPCLLPINMVHSTNLQTLVLPIT